MIKVFKTILFFYLIYYLSACTTTTDQEKRQASTALINTQLGMAYLEKQDILHAKQKLLMALSQKPNIPEPYYSMAYFMEVTGEKETANNYYLKSIQIAPNRGDTHNNYGTFLCRQGNYHEAIKEFLLAVKDPQYLDTASAYENAGLCSMKIPEFEKAKMYFSKALNQDPNRASSLIELAVIDYQQQNYNDAQKKLNHFLTLSPATAESNLLMLQLKNLRSKHVIS